MGDRFIPESQQLQSAVTDGVATRSLHFTQVYSTQQRDAVLRPDDVRLPRCTAVIIDGPTIQRRRDHSLTNRGQLRNCRPETSPPADIIGAGPTVEGMVHQRSIFMLVYVQISLHRLVR